MINSLLFPHKFKKIGWIILVPSLIFGIFLVASEYEYSVLTNKIFSRLPSGINQNFITHFLDVYLGTIVGVLCIVGAMLVGFSREKHEDEFIAKLRLSSLLWAVFVNYFLLLIAFIFVYDFAFINVMVYNMFTVLIIFIFRFNFILIWNNKNLSNAE